MLGWALIGVSSFNILGNMCIVVYFSSQDIGSATKLTVESYSEQRDLEKRLFSNSMILQGTPLFKVLKLREEYKALIWIKWYIPHRHWMLRNNVDISFIADELEYQSYEAKFHFNKRRQQVMMEFSLVFASRVIMDWDMERIAQEQIEAIKAEEKWKVKNRKEEAIKAKQKMLQPANYYGEEEDENDHEEEKGMEKEKEEEVQIEDTTDKTTEEDLVYLKIKNKQFGRFIQP